MRRSGWVGVVLAVALVTGACGGDGDDDEPAADSTEATDDTATDDTATDGSSTAGSDTTAPGGEGTGATDTTAPGDDGGEGEGTEGSTDPGPEATDPGSGPGGELTGEDICQRLPADVAGAALGIDGVTSSPGTSGTPQCSYGFTGPNDIETDATVAALRTVEDLSDRSGAEAYTHVVDLNVQAAQGEVTQTPLEVGDDAVILTGQTLHMAVIRYGERIVTVLLRVEAGDVAAVTRLAEATTVLA